METKKKSNWRFIWVLPILILTITAIPKIAGMEFMVNNMSEAGMGHMTFWVGIIELACVIIFIIPKLRNIGFLLVTAYIGGIISAEWAAGQPVVPGIALQTLLWTGMYFEKRHFFTVS